MCTCMNKQTWWRFKDQKLGFLLNTCMDLTVQWISFSRLDVFGLLAPLALCHECGDHLKTKPVLTDDILLNKIMLQNWIFSSNFILYFLSFEVHFRPLSPYRKRERLVEAPFSKSGLINVTLTLNISNKLTSDVHVKADCWPRGRKGGIPHLFIWECRNTCSSGTQERGL